MISSQVILAFYAIAKGRTYRNLVPKDLFKYVKMRKKKSCQHQSGTEQITPRILNPLNICNRKAIGIFVFYPGEKD